MAEENKPEEPKPEDTEPKDEKTTPQTKAGGHKVGIPEDLEP
ncbi:hypothetical protein [Streptomyces sp. NPDC054975]